MGWWSDLNDWVSDTLYQATANVTGDSYQSDSGRTINTNPEALGEFMQGISPAFGAVAGTRAAIGLGVKAGGVLVAEGLAAGAADTAFNKSPNADLPDSPDAAFSGDASGEEGSLREMLATEQQDGTGSGSGAGPGIPQGAPRLTDDADEMDAGALARNWIIAYAGGTPQEPVSGNWWENVGLTVTEDGDTLDPGKLNDLYRLLTLSGALSFAQYKMLKNRDRLGELTPELVAAVSNAQGRAELVAADDLLSFLQSEAEGIGFGDLVPAGPKPPTATELNFGARGALQDLTGFAREGDVEQVAGSFDPESREEMGTQFAAEVEATRGDEVLGRRALSAVDVLREMVGL